MLILQTAVCLTSSSAYILLVNMKVDIYSRLNGVSLEPLCILMAHARSQDLRTNARSNGLKNNLPSFSRLDQAIRPG